MDSFEKTTKGYRRFLKSPKLRKCRSLAARRSNKKYGNILELEKAHGYSGFKTDQWNSYYQDIIAACMGQPVGMRKAEAIKKHSGLQGLFKKLKRLF